MTLRNSFICPDGFELVSEHVHDYRQHKDKSNGKIYVIDGGPEYMRRSCHGDEVDTSIVWTPEMTHEYVRTLLKWGTMGKKGDEDLKFVTLAEMTTEHINAVLDTQHLSGFYAKAFFAELDYRNP